MSQKLVIEDKCPSCNKMFKVALNEDIGQLQAFDCQHCNCPFQITLTGIDPHQKLVSYKLDMMQRSAPIQPLIQSQSQALSDELETLIHRAASGTLQFHTLAPAIAAWVARAEQSGLLTNGAKLKLSGNPPPEVMVQLLKELKARLKT